MEQRIELMAWRLRQIMKDRHIAVKDLAEELGITRGAVANLRGDEMPRIGSSRVNQIIVALNCLLPPDEEPIGASELLGFGLTIDEMKYIKQRQVENVKRKDKRKREDKRRRRK